MSLLVRACLVWFPLFLVSVATAGEPRHDRCVVVVSLDGLANFYVDDPLSQMPTLRALAAKGARATQGMTASFPTVTWPNHTTLVTGVPPAKHGVLGNSYLDRDTGKSVGLIVDPVFDKSEIVLVPTIYDVAHEAGLKTAGIIWPATRNAKTLDWTVPDMAGEDSWPKYATPGWMAELRAAGLPVDRHAGLTKVPLGGVQRDWLYTRLFSHVIQNHAPNLILVHLVEIDHVEHQFGPRSPEAYWVTSYADDRLRDIVEAAHKSRFGDNVTFVFLSDHGFYPIDKDIRLNALFKLQAGEGKPVGKASTQGGACMIYLSEANRTPEVIQKVKDLIAGVEGVQAVYSPDEFEQLGQFTPDVDRRAPDLWVAAKSGYSFDNSDAGADIVTPRATHGGTHGFLPSEKDLYATLVLSGAGIEPGVDLGEVSNLDVAPTIAELLGVSMPTAQGKVLKAALKK